MTFEVHNLKGNEDKKIFFIYTRVSKEGEYDMSIDDQKEYNIKKIEELGNPYIIIEEKKSGSNKGKREKFDLMLKELMEDSNKDFKQRKYQGIYVFKLDRLARNSLDFKKAEDLLDKGYQIISGTETIENTPTGRLLFRMLSSFGIYESEKLSNRESLATLQNIIKENFKSLGGKTIFGYEINKENKIIINKEKAQLIQKIYNLYQLKLEKDLKTGKKETKNVYEKIFNQLDDSEKLLIINHNNDNVIKKLPEKYTLKKGNLDLIGNILKNKIKKTNYNGYLTRSINVNDELIRDYIRLLIKEKDIDNLKVLGENQIGEKMDYKFYYPELQIIQDEKYNLINRSEGVYKKDKNKEIGKEKKSGFFDGLIFAINEENEKIKFRSDESSDKNRSITYRTEKNIEGIIKQKSERLIEKVLIKTKILSKIKKIKKEHEYFLRKIINYKIIESDNYKSRVLTGKINITENNINNYNDQIIEYEEIIDKLYNLIKIEQRKINDYEFDDKNDPRIKESKSKIKKYKEDIKLKEGLLKIVLNDLNGSLEILDNFKNQKDKIEEIKNDKVDAFFTVFSDVFIVSDRKTKVMGYKVLLKEIEIKQNNKITFYINPFITQLCNDIPKEVTTSLM